MDNAKEEEMAQPLIQPSRQHVMKEGFMKFLVAFEFLERIALRGVQTILALFLLESLHLNEVAATELVHFFLIGSFVSPFIGSFLSDGYMGNYTACYIFSYCELFGHILLTLAAIPIVSWQTSAVNHVLVPIALALVVLGTGALKPCQITFGGDQMSHNYLKKNGSNTSEATKKQASHEFFSAYYMAMNLGTLFSSVVAPILRVQGHGNYFYAFLMPACSMALAILSFWLGRYSYYYRPLPTLIIESVDKPKQASRGTAKESAKLVGVRDEKQTAALETSYMEDLKDTLLVLLIITPCPFFTAMFFQTSSTWVFQARTMDGHVPLFGGFNIQPDQMPALNPIMVLVIIPLMDQIVYPFIEKYICPLPNLKRMVFALISASLSFTASGILQMYINASLQEQQGNGLNAEQADVSLLWQIPQYFLISLAETLMFIPAIDWGYKEAPASMKTVVQAALHFDSAIGNFITIAVVAIIGSGGSKVTESFAFVVLGLIGTAIMAIFSYTYVPREIRLAKRRGSMGTEALEWRS